MFDAQRFTVTSQTGKSSLTSAISDYEVIETVKPTNTDINLVYIDMLIVSAWLLPITLIPLLFVSWYVWPLPYITIILLSIVIISVVGLGRYESNFEWLRRLERVSTGQFDWEKHEVSQNVQSGKTKTVYVDYQALSQGQSQPNDILFGSAPEFSFPPDVLQNLFSLCMSNDFKFNKRLAKQVEGITDSNYNQLVTELIMARWLRLKGQSIGQGVELTAKGKAIVKGRFLPSPTK